MCSKGMARRWQGNGKELRSRLRPTSARLNRPNYRHLHGLAIALPTPVPPIVRAWEADVLPLNYTRETVCDTNGSKDLWRCKVQPLRTNSRRGQPLAAAKVVHRGFNLDTSARRPDAAREVGNRLAAVAVTTHCTGGRVPCRSANRPGIYTWTNRRMRATGASL